MSWRTFWLGAAPFSLSLRAVPEIMGGGIFFQTSTPRTQMESETPYPWDKSLNQIPPTPSTHLFIILGLSKPTHPWTGLVRNIHTPQDTLPTKHPPPQDKKVPVCPPRILSGTALKSTWYNQKPQVSHSYSFLSSWESILHFMPSRRDISRLSSLGCCCARALRFFMVWQCGKQSVGVVRV